MDNPGAVRRCCLPGSVGRIGLPRKQIHQWLGLSTYFQFRVGVASVLFLSRWSCSLLRPMGVSWPRLAGSGILLARISFVLKRGSSEYCFLLVARPTQSCCSGVPIVRRTYRYQSGSSRTVRRKISFDSLNVYLVAVCTFPGCGELRLGRRSCCGRCCCRCQFQFCRCRGFAIVLVR